LQRRSAHTVCPPNSLLRRTGRAKDGPVLFFAALVATTGVATGGPLCVEPPRSGLSGKESAQLTLVPRDPVKVFSLAERHAEAECAAAVVGGPVRSVATAGTVLKMPLTGRSRSQRVDATFQESMRNSLRFEALGFTNRLRSPSQADPAIAAASRADRPAGVQVSATRIRPPATASIQSWRCRQCVPSIR